MDQHQFKISLPVGTKLLVSVVVLLLVVIGFLSTSAILLLTQDKTAYTYQSQTTEAFFAGREFSDKARQLLDALRVYMGNIDPTKPISSEQAARLRNFVENQSDLLGVTLQIVDVKTAAARPLVSSMSAQALSQYQLNGDSLVLTPGMLKKAMPQLLTDSYYFINLSKLGQVPVLGVLLADLKYKDDPAGLPVALATTTLSGFAKEVRSSDLSIANREGTVLFSTDPGLMFTPTNVSDEPLFQASLKEKTQSTTREYEFNGVRYLGGYNRPGYEVTVLTKTEWRKAMSAAYALTEQFILLGIMAICVAIIIAIFFARRLTGPLNQLYGATTEITRGNFDVDLIPQSKDEIGALTSSFLIMSKRIQGLIVESVRKAHLENEVAIASTVQQTLLPAPDYQDSKVILHGHYQSATECGGDWWGYFTLGNKMAIMIADATGHGLPSALITASARSCFSVIQNLAEENNFNLSPKEMLSYANRVVYEAASGQIMMTFFVAVIDFDTGKLAYSSAGHNPPWVFKKTGDKFVLKSLVTLGMRLGEKRDNRDFEEKTIDIASGDQFFLYTDGLIEGKNVQGDMYGKKKMKQLVESQLANSPTDVVNALVTDFMAYNEGKMLDDDVTLAVMRFL
ncbi:MAG: SpoIIE family protein phosphatase [Methylotenera sp.]|nr:SpoIIE family protein phosphatase [Oligoflexia bacterium]